MDETALANNEKTLDAVIRNFQVIGEAARKLPDEIRIKWDELPWGQMMRMRHILVHDYDHVRVDIILRTAQIHLPALIDPLNKLLDEEEESAI